MVEETAEVVLWTCCVLDRLSTAWKAEGNMEFFS